MKPIKFTLPALVLGIGITIVCQGFIYLCVEQIKLILSTSATAFSIQVAASLFLYNYAMARLIKELAHSIKASSLTGKAKEKELAMVKAGIKRWQGPPTVLFIALIALFFSILCSGWIVFIGKIKIVESLSLSCMIVGLLYLAWFVCLLILEVRKLIKCIDSIL